MAVTSTGYQLNKQPIAQSFFIDETNGIYVTKVDLFFAKRDSALPVQIQLRPMVNGLPSASEIIPGSQVVRSSSQVNVDLVGPALTTTSFTFAPNTRFSLRDLGLRPSDDAVDQLWATLLEHDRNKDGKVGPGLLAP